MIVASIKIGDEQLGWYRFVNAPRAGEIIEIFDASTYISRYRVIEVLHVPQPYVHGVEPMVNESVHLIVERLRGRLLE